MKARFVKILTFYAQYGTRSTCVKLRHYSIRNGKNCVYCVFTPKPCHTGDREAYRCVGGVEINGDLSMGDFGSFSGLLVDGTSTPWSKFLAI
jgi:hypothetical protein